MAQQRPPPLTGKIIRAGNVDHYFRGLGFIKITIPIRGDREYDRDRLLSTERMDWIRLRLARRLLVIYLGIRRFSRTFVLLFKVFECYGFDSKESIRGSLLFVFE